MKIIDNNYYLTRLQMQALERSSTKWIDMFEIGSILHIKEHNCKITTMIVELSKTLNPFV